MRESVSVYREPVHEPWNLGDIHVTPCPMMSLPSTCLLREVPAVNRVPQTWLVALLMLVVVVVIVLPALGLNADSWGRGYILKYRTYNQ